MQSKSVCEKFHTPHLKEFKSLDGGNIGKGRQFQAYHRKNRKDFGGGLTIAYLCSIEVSEFYNG